MSEELLKAILEELRQQRERTEPAREILTIEEAADYLRLSPHTVREKMRLQLIPYYRVGGSIRFRRSKLDAWLDTGEIIARNTEKP